MAERIVQRTWGTVKPGKPGILCLPVNPEAAAMHLPVFCLPRGTSVGTLKQVRSWCA